MLTVWGLPSGQQAFMDSARAKMTTRTKNFKRNLSTSASPPFAESGQPLFSQQRIFPALLTGPFDFSKFCRTLQYRQGKHLAGVQFLLHLSEFPPVIPAACGLDEIYHLKCSPCYGTIGGKRTQGQNCNATDPIYSYLFDGETMRCYNRFNSGKQRMFA